MTNPQMPTPTEPGLIRLCCFTCGKSVSTPVPNETIVRAIIECPECFEAAPAPAAPVEAAKLKADILRIAMDSAVDDGFNLDDFARDLDAVLRSFVQPAPEGELARVGVRDIRAMFCNSDWDGLSGLIYLLCQRAAQHVLPAAPAAQPSTVTIKRSNDNEN